MAAEADNVLSLSTQLIGFDTQAVNTFFAGPLTGSNTAPSFRIMGDADIPSLITRDIEWNAMSNGTYIGTGATTSRIEFTNQTAMSIMNGDVGIGTTNPTTKFHVNGTAEIISTIESNNSRVSLLLKAGDVGDVGWLLMSGFPAVGDFNIREYGTANDFTIKKTTGYVGIGTVLPTALLDVNGTINATAGNIGAFPIVTNGTALSGDVTGNITATVVGDDSHYHNTTYYIKSEVLALENLTNYYNETEVVALNTLTNFYNKTEVVALHTFTNFYNKTETVALATLTNFYNKTDIDAEYNATEILALANLTNYYNKTETVALATFTNFYNKTDTLALPTLTNFYNKTDTLALPTLTNFYNKTDIDAAIVTQYHHLGFTITNGTNDITTGWYCCARATNNFTATAWEVISTDFVVGNITIAVKKLDPGAGAANYTEANFSLCSGTENITLSSDQFNEDTALGSFNTTIAKGEYYGCNVTATDTVNQIYWVVIE